MQLSFFSPNHPLMVTMLEHPPLALELVLHADHGSGMEALLPGIGHDGAEGDLGAAERKQCSETQEASRQYDSTTQLQMNQTKQRCERLQMQDSTQANAQDQ
jgi:hypothetical protein